MKHQMFKPGTLELGVNYWPSETATEMWKKWNPASIDKDFEVLEAHHLKLVRCFASWEDFQPIKFMVTPGKTVMETRFDDDTALPDTDAGRAGVSDTMMERFETFCDLASNHHLELIVCIMTSQMTFRLFTPPALANRDLYLDPRALNWEGRYIRYFVNRMKHHPAIRAWESGNESCCLGPVPNGDTPAFWMNFINTVIRQADPSRPVIGVNDSNITLDNTANHWRLVDIAEVSDLVSTHPYPMFDNTQIDDYTGIRSAFQGATKNRLQSQIGQLQSFIEETGVRRACSCGTRHIGDAVRSILWSSWQANCLGYLWWCAFDQNLMTCAPYDWPQPTLELGAFKADRTPLGPANAMKTFAEFLEKLPFKTLPERHADAVCFAWDNAISSTADILAAMNGAELKFQAPYQTLQDAKIYMLPSIAKRGSFNTNQWEALKEKVRAGATLYISLADCFLTDLEDVCGAGVVSRTEPHDATTYTFADASLKLPRPVFRKMETLGADILATDADGNPVAFRNRYGEGLVYTLSFELETLINAQAGGYDSDAWKVYRLLFGDKIRLLATDTPRVIASDHYFDDSHAAVILNNCSPKAADAACRLAPGWKITGVFSDVPDVDVTPLRATLPPNTAAVATLEKCQ